jgi:hypothetical protein
MYQGSDTLRSELEPVLGHRARQVNGEVFDKFLKFKKNGLLQVRAR